MDILISTLYRGTAAIRAIKLFSPQKVYFIVDKPVDSVRENAVEMITDLYPKLTIELVSVKTYDIVNIADETIKIIKKERENNITLHISEARKTMSLGTLFGSYVMKPYVNSVYYIIEETNQPLKIPLLELKVSSKKKQILNLINNGMNNIEELVKKLNVNRSTLYVHFKELRDEGFLDKKNNLTEMGRIVLLP